MKNSVTLLLSLALLLPAAHAARNNDRAARQAELDQACEQAREEKLAPERQKYIEECVEKKQLPDRESCERFYADHGNKTGNRAPLYYDLPQCVEAYEYRNSAG